MAFSRVNPSGWATGDQLTPAQANQLDVNQSRAVDGNAGGSYTPSGAIVLGGSGVQIANTATLTINSGGTISGAAGSTATLAGTNTFSGTTTQSGALTVTGATVRSGTGATYRERVTNASDSDGTYTTDYDAYRVPDVTGNRTYTLSNPSADGFTLLFSRVGATNAFGVAIRRADTTLIGTLPSSQQSWIMFKSLGGVWTSFMWGGGASSVI